MNNITQAVETIDYTILKGSSKDLFEAYNSGLRAPKLNASNDIDYLLQLNKSFFSYYNTVINSLPENDQPLERIKWKLAGEVIENAIKSLSFNKNVLDKNNFLFYNIAYVSDIIKRNSSINNKE
jgi:hypothetical protein